MLCRTGVDDPDCRQRLHLFVRDARRDLRLDHRLGPDSRIRGQQRRRSGGFRRIYESATGGLRSQFARQMGESRVGRRAMDRRLLQSAGISDRLHSHAAAGARSEGIGRDQQHHGRGQDRRDSDFPGRRRNAGEARELDALRAFGLCRNRHRRRDRFLHLHRIRLGLNRRGRIAQSAKRFALRHHHVADRLHAALCRRRFGAARHDEVHDLRFRRSRRRAGRLRDEVSGRASVLPLGDRDRRADGDDLVVAGVSVRAGAHLVCHVARRLAAKVILRGASEI